MELSETEVNYLLNKLDADEDTALAAKVVRGNYNLKLMEKLASLLKQDDGQQK